MDCDREFFFFFFFDREFPEVCLRKHEWTTAKRAQRSDMKLPKGKKKKGWLVLKKTGRKM